MNKVLSLLLLSVTVWGPQSARAFSTEANQCESLETDCPDLLPTNGVPVFAVYRVRATVHTENYEDDTTEDQAFDAFILKNGRVEILTNYAASTSGGDPPVVTDYDVFSYKLATDFNYGCGRYINADDSADTSGGADCAWELASAVDYYLAGDVQPPGWYPDATITEKHDGSSFSVTCHIDDSFTARTYTVFREYDGALLPTRNLKHGRDNDPCEPGCGMPVWHISQPYLNLWVHDKPVFYRTSLGQEIGFQVDYKQRDTRPRDDGVYPTTGWSHNWYSYVHFDIPVVGTVGEGNNDLARISPRGVRIRNNWALSAHPEHWEAILYAPDNSESYFRYDNSTDPQNQRTLVPIAGDGGIGGFRVVHGDGSQDIYSRVRLVQQQTYGIVERFGCVFDKAGLTNGMAAVWTLPLPGASTPHQDWQDGDDAANYTSEAVFTNTSAIQQLAYTDDSTCVEYVSYDALLTARVDPYGNAITLNYDDDNRLTTLTDYDGMTTHLYYDSGNRVRSVEMPYGRTATFVYGTGGNLTSITDAQEMTSSMTYVSANDGLNYRLSSLTTLYGTTHFEYQDSKPYVSIRRPAYMQYGAGGGSAPQVGAVIDTREFLVYKGENGVNHAIIVTYPDASKELYAYYGTTNTQVPHLLQTSVSGVDDGQAGGEASLRPRNVFHWSRAQTPLLSLPVSASMALTNLTAEDFLKGTWQHFPIMNNGLANVDIAPGPSFIQEASPDGYQPGNITWFTYDSGSGWQLNGEALNWTQITLAPDGTELDTEFAHDSGLPDARGLLTSISEPCSREDGSIDSRAWGVTYFSVPVQEPNGLTWYLHAPKGLMHAGLGIFNVPDESAPEAAQVDAYTALSWPVVEVSDGGGYSHKFFFNSRHQLTGAKYANGLTVTNLYDANHFLQKSIALEKHATNTYTFQNGELAALTTPLGLTLTFTHDMLGRLTEVDFPDGTSLQNLFYRLDLVAQKDRLNHWSYAGYNSLDQLTAITNRNGGVTSFTYCGCGGLESVTDPEQHTTILQRDYLGRVTNTVSSAGNVAIQRDVLGRPFQVTSDWGLDLSLMRNYQGLVTGVANPAGTALSVTYDPADRPIYLTDARGISVTNNFDALGRLNYRDGAFGRIEERYYSAQGLFNRYDALHHLTIYGYDDAGRLAAITNSNEEVTQFGYDCADNLVSLTDGRNHTKGWHYDIYARQIAETNANNVLVKTNGYDANSRLTAQWTAAMGLTTFNYDNNANLLGVHYPHAAAVTFTYDFLNRLKTMNDAVGNHTFTYADFGAFDSALASEAGPYGTVSHAYTGPNLASISADSWVVGITNDAALRPHIITSPAGTFTYTFKGASRQVASLDGPRNTTTFGYDLAGELKSVGVTNTTGTALDYHRYDYDDVGLIKTAYRLKGSTNNYAYDNIGQLTMAQAFEPDSTPRLNENLGYAYDASGNLQWRTNNTLLQSFTCDPANELVNITRSGTLTVSGSLTGAVAILGVNGKAAKIYSDSTFATTEGVTLRDGNNLFVTAGSNAAGQLVLSTITSNRLPVSVNFAYDRNGNLLGDGQQTYAYDDANQLTNVTAPGLWKTDFVFDGLGRRRITREYIWDLTLDTWHLAQETRYLCDGMLPIQELDENGVVRVKYTRGLDLSGSFGGAGGIGGLLARTDGSGSAYYHGDVGGNITSLTDSGGGVAARYLYDPFGRLTGKWGALADVNRYRFSSKEVDPHSGLYYYGFRFFDSNLQRWLSQDPIGEWGGMNLYGFAGNQPPNSMDPFGLAECYTSRAHDLSSVLQEGIPGPLPYIKREGDGNDRWYDGPIGLFNNALSTAGNTLYQAGELLASAGGALDRAILGGTGELGERAGGVVPLILVPEARAGRVVSATGDGRLLSSIGGESMDRELYERIRTAFQRKPGRIMESSPLSEAHLGPDPAIQGETLSKDCVALRQNPSTSSVYEELIHTAQKARGMTDVTGMEIEAQQKLIRFADRYHIPPEQTQDTIRRLNDLLKSRQ